ncbi:MAG: hypothetical protein M1823_000773 [Watsoniomyces obsoletus]|nr:MAG: hypothetical protein M1823_000773 [Watsoniomyces obsoletus]
MATRAMSILLLLLTTLVSLSVAIPQSHPSDHVHVTNSTSEYSLKDEYNAENFFQEFDFFTGEDPTHGYVRYVDEPTARNASLISTGNGTVYMGVDHQNVALNGRPSVRVSSKKSYNKVLIVADMNHMPGGACGTWPAFWTLGPNWPFNGELDIVEGINDQTKNLVAFHTGVDCLLNGTAQSGRVTSPNCNNDPSKPINKGCQSEEQRSNSYGAEFNQNGGGVYALDWTSEALRVFFFSRESIPADIKANKPNPATWGIPVMNVQGPGCDLDKNYRDQKIMFTMTFCGDWADGVWPGSTCAAKTKQTCSQYVAQNPADFKDQYWSINSVKVFDPVQ